jgi:tRNA pseudouridine55 synthase
MASGVLVLLFSEATKLSAQLTAHAKRYRASVAFGLTTDTLDRLGTPPAAHAARSWHRRVSSGARSRRAGPARAGATALQHRSAGGARIASAEAAKPSSFRRARSR